MARCCTCLRNFANPEFDTSRITVCGNCVSLLNASDLTPAQAEANLRDRLHTSMWRKLLAQSESDDRQVSTRARDRMVSWPASAEEFFPTWLNNRLASPQAWGLEIKLVRAYRRQLVRWKRGNVKYPGNWPNVSRLVKGEDGDRCALCGIAKPANELHAHHIVFRSNGGTNSKHNLATLCFECHQNLHPNHVITACGGEPEDTDFVEADEFDAASPSVMMSVAIEVAEPASERKQSITEFPKPGEQLDNTGTAVAQPASTSVAAEEHVIADARLGKNVASPDADVSTSSRKAPPIPLPAPQAAIPATNTRVNWFWLWLALICLVCGLSLIVLALSGRPST